MTTTEVWSSLEPGQGVAIIGERIPPAPPEWRVVRIHCGGPREALRPLREAIQRIDLIVGQPAAFVRSARRVRRGLRAYVLGEEARPGLADLAEALNRLADTAPRTALIFDRIELADLDTLSTLRHLLETPGRLRPALLLHTAHAPLTGDAAAALLAVVSRTLTREPAPVAQPPSLEGMPWEARRALRAAATIGEGFEITLLGALLDVHPLRVLEWLQVAHDSGAPLEDLGTGCFQLPSALAAQLREERLPSLAQAWHRRLAEILSPPQSAPDESPVARVAAEDAEDAEEVEADVEEDVEIVSAPLGAAIPEPDVVDIDPDQVELVELADLSHRGWAPLAPPQAVVTDTVDVEPLEDDEEEDAVEEAVSGAALVMPEVEVPAGESEDLSAALEPAAGPSRAAAHLDAAGEVVAAARAWLSAAQQATPMAMVQLVAHGERILQVLVAAAEGRRGDPVLAVELWAELGHLKLEGCSPGGGFRLDAALEDLEQALAAAQALEVGRVPVLLVSRIRSDIAMACYERGDAASLERALAELTRASRALLDAGEALVAARLLNDQAAVWVRLGDPVRAAGLLRESRKLFLRLEDSPIRDRELAETYLLLARLPLHVAARPGAEHEALAAALGHAHDAAQIYARLGMPREQARSREVAGRLHLRAGDRARAAEALQGALRIQSAAGDALGMAQTTGALAELAREQGQVGAALELLMVSIQRNVTRGSPLGLQHNREGLAALADLLPAPVRDRAEAALQSAEDRLGVARSDKREEPGG